MTFVERAVILDRLGIGYHQEEEWRGKPSRPERIELFKDVHLPLTAEEWLSVAMADGKHYLGGCCGAMSHLQDIVEHVFRMGSGWATCHDLEEMALIIFEHGDFKSEVPWGVLPKPVEELVPVYRSRGRLSPWDKMALCWHLVRDHYAPKVPVSAARNRSPLDEAIHVLSRSLQYFDLKHIFRPDEDDRDRKVQSEATNLVILARTLPALRTLNEGIEQMGLAPIEGFALVDKSAPENAVCSNGSGFCIFGRRERAEELLRLWIQSAEQYKEDERRQHLHDHIGIRPVRVTREKGIEFLDGDEGAPS